MSTKTRNEPTFNAFTTADGRTIDFIDGYYEAHNRKRSGYVADNVFVGRHSQTELLGWTDRN